MQYFENNIKTTNYFPKFVKHQFLWRQIQPIGGHFHFTDIYELCHFASLDQLYGWVFL